MSWGRLSYRFVIDSVKNESNGWASPIVFGPRTLARTWGTRVDLRDRNGLTGSAAGHPAVGEGIEPNSVNKMAEPRLRHFKGNFYSC
jgi:hypothetical protein